MVFVFLIVTAFRLTWLLNQRPLNEKEIKSNTYSAIECNEKRKEIVVIDKSTASGISKTFTFDRVGIILKFLCFYLKK